MKVCPILYPEGPGKREVCGKGAAGRREYRHRLQLMHERQDGLCCLCALPLRLEEAVFEHQRPKGMGGAFTDDRIEVDGVPINGAAHWNCNSSKGSKRTPYLIQPQVPNFRSIEECLPQE